MSKKAAARLVSVNTGRPKASPHRGKRVPSKTFKTPVKETLRIDESSSKETPRPTSPPTVTVGESS